MTGKKLLIVSAILISSESAFVDTIKKCSVPDNLCQKNFIQSMLRNAGKTGIPEWNVKSIDPLEIDALHIAVLDLIDITLKDGTVKGIKNCDVLKYIANFDTGHASVEIVCNISIKSKYKASSSSPLLKTIFGAESVHGEGEGKVKIEKIKISFDYTFDIIKRDNNLYIQVSFDKSKYSYDILGGGNLCQTIVKIMNENWKMIMDSVGKTIMDIAMGYVYDFTKDFFNKVPMKYFIIEDLSSQVIS